MAVVVEVPKLGNTVEECLISRWAKHKGDTVAAGDLLAEIETDKATFEVTAPTAGTLLETRFEEGAYAPVFATLCVILESGESAAAEASAASPAEVTAAAWSPRARRFADEHDFHPAAITGSGPGGRVLESDVKTAFAAAPRPTARASGIRETIARRMRESLATTAQYTLNASANAGALIAARARLKASPATAGITISDLLALCTVRALLEMPALNAELIDGRIVQHSEIHLGFACDTPRGLLVPVIRNAHRLALAELARQASELAARAVDGSIAPDDLSGATFTISNLGSLGIESFTPVLNAPQVAILGIGAIQLKPIRRDGHVEFADTIGLSLTCDHQAIDGAPGARFLKLVMEKIESVEP